MKYFKPTIFFLLLHLTLTAAAQDTQTVHELNAAFQVMYGPDQNLVSGVRYYNLYTRYKGHRYFGEDRYSSGTLYLDRGVFRELNLKYDLYGQQVIMKVVLGDGNYFEILVTDSRLLGFDLGNRKFRKEYFPLTDTLLFQVLGKEEPYCYIHWSKEVVLNRTDLNDVDEFTNPKRKHYLLINSGLHPFKSSRSFSRAFPGHRSEVMSYLRRNKIRLKKAGDLQIESVLGYCRDLLKEGGER